MSRPDLQALLEQAGIKASAGVPLKGRGYYKLGGPAEAFASIERVEQLCQLMALGVPVTVIGRGSNLLIADAGIPGVVIRLQGELRGREVLDGVLEVGAGVSNAPLLRWVARHGLGGLACIAGVPGTIGGAVRMNAGWSAGEISSILIDADVVLPGGELVTLSSEALAFSYRRSAGLPAGSVVTKARLSLLTDAAEVEAEQARIQHYLARRKATQPLDKPSCGSVFKNPPGDYAGRLIEASGLKGHVIGGAQVSDVHANFIVNNGGTAGDVYALIRLVRRTVWARHGVLLAPEVHAVGAWPEGAWPLPHPEHDD